MNSVCLGKPCVLLVLLFFTTIMAQFNIIRPAARWCTINQAEEKKCLEMKNAVETRHEQDPQYPPGRKSYPELPAIECVKAAREFDCMNMISSNLADLITLDAGLGYTAGEYYRMRPLMAERYLSPDGKKEVQFNAVAVAKKSNRDVNLKNLEGKNVCHPSVGQAAGWTYPISLLIEEKIMKIEECNVPVKSAATFFGGMCAPNGLLQYYNPFGNNPISICKNCQGKAEAFCTSQDPYAGYHGAFTCMSNGNGDVAFVTEFTVSDGTANTTETPADYELLCPDGSRKPVSQVESCNLGKVSSHIVMTSAMHSDELKNLYKELLQQLSDDFGKEGGFKNIFKMFESEGHHNVLFLDKTEDLEDVSKILDGDDNPRDSYYTWAGPEYRKKLESLNQCPVQQARWCVTSKHEMEKCENMIMAFAAKTLKPDLNCVLGESNRDCMSKIQEGDADLVTLDAAEVYAGGKYFNLIPIAMEDYSGYDKHIYYGVAVARRTDSHITIFNLKNKRTCHSGVMKAAGWIMPVDKLIETGQIVVKDCNLYNAVGQFFSKSCVPGILNTAYNPYDTNPINMCEACASGGKDRCQRNDEELYYGDSGAFRCLTEMGGNVAFVKHTTVRENTDGRNRAEWARNRRTDDYELLCNDGTRQDIDNWENCNTGELPANAIVTAGYRNKNTRSIYWTLLNYAQQFFAPDENSDFRMFQSLVNHKDLIFQDSTVRLVEIPVEKQSYKEYLSPSFLRAMERLESVDCTTSSTVAHYVNLALLIILYFIISLT